MAYRSDVSDQDLRYRLRETYARMAEECLYRPTAYADQLTGALEERQDSFEVEADRWAMRWLATFEERVEEALYGASTFNTRHINALQAEAIIATYCGRPELALSLSRLIVKMLEEADLKDINFFPGD